MIVPVGGPCALNNAWVIESMRLSIIDILVNRLLGVEHAYERAVSHKHSIEHQISR